MNVREIVKNIVLVLFVFCFHSCYDYFGSYGEEIQNNIENTESKHRYMSYKNKILSDYDSCYIVIHLENLLDDCEENFKYITKNEKVEINGDEIKIEISNLSGYFKRYMDLYVYPELIINVNDTISLF